MYQTKMTAPVPTSLYHLLPRLIYLTKASHCTFCQRVLIAFWQIQCCQNIKPSSAKASRRSCPSLRREVHQESPRCPSPWKSSETLALSRWSQEWAPIKRFKIAKKNLINVSITIYLVRLRLQPCKLGE